MSKVIIPQIGDFVQGQQLTEPGFNALNDISDKLDTLENVASEDFAEDLAELEEKIEAVRAEFLVRPKIEVVTGVDRISPLDTEYNLYNITVEYEITLVGGSSTPVGIVPDLGLSTSGLYVNRSFNAISATIKSSLSFTTTYDHIAAEDNQDVVFYNPSSRTVGEFKWIILKYKTE